MYTYIHKALYIVTNEFLGKLCLRFSSSEILTVFDKTLFQPEHFLGLCLDEFECHFF